MLKKLLIGLSIFIGIGILVLIGWTIMLLLAIGIFEKDYSVSDLKSNFAQHESEIYELKRYFNEIAPQNRFVEIEFENNSTLGRFGIKALDSTAGNPNGPMFLEWNLQINTIKMDSLIKPLGWTRETLKTLKEKLDNANCIQIESGEPSRIGFKRCAMGMYSFNVFDQPIPEILKNNYNDSCRYILANDKLVLEYGGGALGSQCFYNLK